MHCLRDETQFALELAESCAKIRARITGNPVLADQEMPNRKTVLDARDGKGEQPWPRSQDPSGRQIYPFVLGDYSLEYMSHGAVGLRPLVILQSLEYPGWPAPDFCSLAEKAGYRTLCVRRPGFGGVPPVPDLDAQVSLIGGFFRDQELDDVVLICSGTANMLGYRLAQDESVGLTVLANCCFNHDPMAEIRPDWFARAVQETLTSAAGARMALVAMKSSEGVFGKYWVTENFMQKSPGDLAYLHRNRELFSEAVDSLHRGLDIHTFIMELRSTLQADPFLQDGCFEGVNVISVSGLETSEHWQAAIRAEAGRVGVPLHFFPSGDALVIYQSAGELMDLLRQYA